MRLDVSVPFLLCTIACSATAFGSEPVAPLHTGASATIARDINGFKLGMPISDALKRVTVTFRQDEMVQSVMDGIAYDFGVCRSGRIYRIESHQELGNFLPDQVFTDRLQSDLFAKYGAASGGSPDNLSWELVEPVRFSDGAVRQFKTNWFSALLSSFPNGPVSLDLRMLDFRVCWEDNIKANAPVRDAANDKVVF
jgi:hypothetical protein